jgi:hypothetical protein
MAIIRLDSPPMLSHFTSHCCHIRDRAPSIHFARSCHCFALPWTAYFDLAESNYLHYSPRLAALAVPAAVLLVLVG